MGINSYLVHTRFNKEKGIEGIRVDKRSGGWVFHFEAYSEPNIKTVKDWRFRTKTGFIYDEYDREYTYEQFWKAVEDTKKQRFGRAPYVLEDAENPAPFFPCWEDEGFTEGDFS